VESEGQPDRSSTGGADRRDVRPTVHRAAGRGKNCRRFLDALDRRRSGGGSPAIPLKLVEPALDLTLVESKARKAALLREVVRELGLIRTSVETSRFEELASRTRAEASAGLLTIRAVRLEPKLSNQWLGCCDLAGDC
jgi:hypothetical protein